MLAMHETSIPLAFRGIDFVTDVFVRPYKVKSMCRVFSMTFALVFVLNWCSLLHAWNDAGHLTIARIAWDSMSVDERAAVITILRKHPHLESLLLKDRPGEAMEDEWIFLRAAVWADYVRPSKSTPPEDVPNHPLYKFHRGPWHYVNYPYTAGQASSELPPKQLPNETNILKQLELTMEILTGRTTSDVGRVAGISDDQNRAVRMTWLFHLVGDLHQPLHTVALIDPTLFPEPPHGDQGGNKLAIRADVNSMPKSLHWCWDEMYSTDSHFDQVCRQSERLTHDPAYSSEQLRELSLHPSFSSWAGESYTAAKSHVYQEGRLKLVLWDQLNAGTIPQSDVPSLTAEALKDSRQLAERRVVLAGHRLARSLKEIVKK